MTSASERRARLAAHPELLRALSRGVEKESLRATPSGDLALTPHPASLGSALAHPYITTDFAEALIELVTQPHHSVGQLVDELTDVHSYVAQHNPTEILWNQSMPARLPAESEIPIAWYGRSNSGLLKHVYRVGLTWRYGKIMQCIAGVHYNFSLPEAAWGWLADGENAQARRNNGYMGLIRNFMRHSWLLMYLFGASPAVSDSFFQHPGLRERLVALGKHSWGLPWATSLRMSDLGYKNTIQSELALCYNDLDTFTARIHSAVTTPWPAYEAIGTHRDGQRIQINTNLLQIENEYYSSIRPKQTAGRGERPNTILQQRGIQYIEVRCMDIDPWAPIGISAQTSRFLDAFLLCCAVEDSPLFPSPGDCRESQENFARVAREGRRPGLLLSRDDQPVSLQDWAIEAIETILPYADLLDTHTGDSAHRAAVEAQRAKALDSEATPSARVLDALASTGQEFHTWALRLSQAHWDHLSQRKLSAPMQATLDAATRDSVTAQAAIEAGDQETFEAYVARFQAALT